jgi:hypothetical protein
MEKRRAGEMTTLECRAEAEESVDKALRQKQVVEILEQGGEMSAKEIAVEMMNRGYVPTSERNWSSPRITELCRKGIIEPVGRKKCQYSGKSVTVFAIREE